MSHFVINTLHTLRFEDLPSEVVQQTQRCLLDLIGVAAGGSSTELATIICQHAVQQFGSSEQGARILFDGRRSSPVGAALAGGMSIDSLDAHDGHPLTKGHAGVALLPALLAYIDSGYAVSGREFLTSLALGYEFAIRAGMALHASVSDYHTSGAWNALACAALGARLMQLDTKQTCEALGIAEYHGPRSQMMRCIDYPTMVKDGSGWGAMAGVSAAYLAAAGFTGAPAITVEADELQSYWNDLGQRWRIMEQYFKPYPVCRWAQPAVEAALSLIRAHQISADEIETIHVFSFYQAVKLACREPTGTDAAQYSLPFSVATALINGQLGAAEVTGKALTDPRILRLSNAMVLIEDADYSALFPAERWAHVEILLQNGQRLISAPTIARGNAENALSEAEMKEKYRQLSQPVLGVERSQAIQDSVIQLSAATNDTALLLDLLLQK